MPRSVTLLAFLPVLIFAGPLRAGEADGKKIDRRTVLAAAREMLSEERMKRNLSRWTESAVPVAVETCFVDKKAGAAMFETIRRAVDAKLAETRKKSVGRKTPHPDIAWLEAVRAGVELLEGAACEPDSNHGERMSAFRKKAAALRHSMYLDLAVINALEHARPELVSGVAEGSKISNVRVPAARVLFEHHLAAGRTREAIAGGGYFLERVPGGAAYLAAGACRKLAKTADPEALKAARKCLEKIVSSAEKGKGEYLYHWSYGNISAAAAAYMAFDEDRATKLQERLKALTSETVTSSLEDMNRQKLLSIQHVHLAFLSWLGGNREWERLYASAVKYHDSACEMADNRGAKRDRMLMASVKGLPDHRALRDLAKIDPRFLGAVYEKFVKGKTFELGNVGRDRAIGFRMLTASRCDVRHNPRRVMTFIDECCPKVKYGPTGYPLLLARLAMHLRKQEAAAKKSGARKRVEKKPVSGK